MNQRARDLPLKAVRASLRKLRRLGASAAAVQQTRAGSYRYWDPEILVVDRTLEDIYLDFFRRSQIPARFISEEVGDISLADDHHFVIFCDPFDGSALYRRRISAFWFTAVGIYTANGKPISAAVGDGLSLEIIFSAGPSAFCTHLSRSSLKEPVRPSETNRLADAYLATYLMKPHFLYPTVENFKKLFQSVKMVIPNGGPAGFADVASGKCDIYLAIRQPITEVFSALPIALAAGCVVTDFEGKPVAMVTDINGRLDLVVCANKELHQQVLRFLTRGVKGDRRSAESDPLL